MHTASAKALQKSQPVDQCKRYKCTVYVYRHLLCVLHGFLGPTMSWPPQTAFVSLHACILQSWTCWKTKETCMRRLTFIIFIQSHVPFICPLTSPHPRSPTRPWSPRHQSGSAANGVPWPSGWCTRHQLRPPWSAANPTGRPIRKCQVLGKPGFECQKVAVCPKNYLGASWFK